MTIVEDRICDLDARGSEEADNLANDRDLDRFIITGESLISLYQSFHDCFPSFDGHLLI